MERREAHVHPCPEPERSTPVQRETHLKLNVKHTHAELRDKPIKETITRGFVCSRCTYSMCLCVCVCVYALVFIMCTYCSRVCADRDTEEIYSALFHSSSETAACFWISSIGSRAIYHADRHVGVVSVTPALTSSGGVSLCWYKLKPVMCVCMNCWPSISTSLMWSAY